MSLVDYHAVTACLGGPHYGEAVGVRLLVVDSWERREQAVEGGTELIDVGADFELEQ